MGNHRKPVNAQKLADFQIFFNHQRLRVGSKMERVKGIEPSSLAWEAPDFLGFLRASEQNGGYSTPFVSIG